MWCGEVDGTGIVILDPRFNACFAGHLRVERLWTGARWTERPGLVRRRPPLDLVRHPQSGDARNQIVAPRRRGGCDNDNQAPLFGSTR